MERSSTKESGRESLILWHREIQQVGFPLIIGGTVSKGIDWAPGR